MTLPVRMQKITQSLSPLQRISLLLQGYKEGRAPDPGLSQFSDPQQASAFRRFVALHYTSNIALGTRCEALLLITGDLEDIASQLRLLEQAAGVLEEEHGLVVPRRLRDWQQAREMDVNEFLRSLARDARSGLIDGLALRWQELRAIELIWDELASEFGGADPVEPMLREKAGQVSRSLRSLAREMKATRRLVEPEESIVTEARVAVDDAFKKMEPLL